MLATDIEPRFLHAFPSTTWKCVAMTFAWKGSCKVNLIWHMHAWC